MTNSSYDGTGTNILTGAVIVGTFFLLVAVLASTGASFGGVAQTTTRTPAIETVVVTAAPAASHS